MQNVQSEANTDFNVKQKAIIRHQDNSAITKTYLVMFSPLLSRLALVQLITTSIVSNNCSDYQPDQPINRRELALHTEVDNAPCVAHVLVNHVLDSN